MVGGHHLRCGEKCLLWMGVWHISNQGGSNSVFAYNPTNDKWSELPKCPTAHVSLAMVNSLLTPIGGRILNYEDTNSLLSLTDNKWTKQFPPMPPKCWLTGVVCRGRSLIVAEDCEDRNT